MISVTRLIRASFGSIMKNRMRSLLTSLGIIIGVGAVIVMVAIGQGTSAKIESSISSLGTNLIMASPGSQSSGGVRLGAGTSNQFTLDDIKRLKKEATLLDGVSPVVRAGGQVIGGGNNWQTTIYGVTPDYLTVRNWTIESGVALAEKDVVGNRKVAILGKSVADELFPSADPLGKKIRIRNVPFTVIGVLKAKGASGMGPDQDDLILAPVTAVMYSLKGNQKVDMINASAVSAEKVDSAMAEMRVILRSAHKLQGNEDDDFTVSSQAEVLETVSSIGATMTLLLSAIAAVSLVVGGIGIMNIMLVSVTERTREIGIRLSVGARESDIMTQFLSEAVVLSVSGGIIGIGVASIAVYLMNQWTSLMPVITAGTVALSFLFSAGVGIFFGFYPARKAAALNPIDALRHE
jgi:putative ABC transport system permease protein